MINVVATHCFAMVMKCIALCNAIQNDPFHCRCSFIGQQDISPPPSDVDSSGDHYAAFKRGVNLWNEPTVTVAFTPTSFNYIETRNATWKLDSIEKILELANTWHKLQKDPKHIPKFIPFPGQNIQRADIIVELNGNNNAWL